MELSNRYAMAKPGSFPQSAKSNNANVSFDEVAKYFPVPIAEAATLLGVTTNYLKQICKENGILRWPYLKVLAGKTIEDIKREGAKEKSLIEEMAKRAAQQHSSVPPHVTTSGNSAVVSHAPVKGGTAHPESVRWQSGNSTPTYVLHQPPTKSLPIDQRSQIQQQSHIRVISIPTYLDEFRHGFPKKGLSVVSNKWWGGAEMNKGDHASDGTEMTQASEMQSLAHGKLEQNPDDEEHLLCSRASSRTTIKEGKLADDLLMPASLLRMTRKKSAVGGRKALGLAVTRGYGKYKLAEKDEALLRAVFDDYFPGLWRVYMSS